MKKDDLKTLLPGNEVTVAGEVITIQPFRFVDVPKAISLAGKLGNLFFDVVRSINKDKSPLDTLGLLDMQMMAAEKGIEIPEAIHDNEDEVRAFLGDALAENSEVGISFENNVLSIKEGTIEAVTVLLNEGGDSLMELVKLAVRKDQEWLESLDYAEGLEVVLAIIEVNLDFFKKRLTPLMTTRLAALTARNKVKPKK
jgi:hypothetical protein